MKLVNIKTIHRIVCECTLDTGLLVRSGDTGALVDAELARSFDGRIYISGYAWASLFRRVFGRFSSGKFISENIGDYDTGTKEPADRKGISSLWCESSFIDPQVIDIVQGNRLSRDLGSCDTGALYSFELLPAGHSIEIRCTCFQDSSDDTDFKEEMRKALWVINDHIETIGGGWSYGYGRLNIDKCYVDSVEYKDLKDPIRSFQNYTSWGTISPQFPSDICEPWVKIAVESKVGEGQLLAINADHPHGTEYIPASKYPDSFLYRQWLIDGNRTMHSTITITGKAFRQAMLMVPLERKWRTIGDDICASEFAQENCNCKRCTWFGATSNRSLISVGDASVSDPGNIVLSRIKLCEHTMQNDNLFAGEFLQEGSFSTEIVLNTTDDEIISTIVGRIEELKPGSDYPPNWDRLGGTNTATGQIDVVALEHKVCGGAA